MLRDTLNESFNFQAKSRLLHLDKALNEISRCQYVESIALVAFGALNSAKLLHLSLLIPLKPEIVAHSHLQQAVVTAT